MRSMFLISLLFNLLLLISTVTQDYPPFLYTFCFSDKGNYSTNSIYHTNLNQLLSSLPSSSNGYGFYNSSRGQNPDKAYAIGLCRGDIKPDDCGSCLNDVRYLLIKACPSQKEAIGWYQNCMLRFSNRSLHASMEVIPTFSLWNVNAVNVSAGDVAAGFNRKLRTLLKTLRSEAAGGGDLLKFATGSASVRVGPRNSNQLTIYALVQCTPDLSEKDCKRCLYEAFGYIPRCCHGKDTGRLLKPSCNLRFELSLFFDPPATVLPLPVSHDSPPSISVNTTSQGMENKTIWIVMTIGLAGVVGVLVLIICCCSLRVNTKETVLPTTNFLLVERPQMTSSNVTEISFEAVKFATGDFDEENKLGEGGFGSVYKGRLNGQDIAVKRLSTEHGQGDVEFSNEVSILGNLQHDNLVKLLHFSVEGNERVLVYEFVPNASLNRFIFDQNEGEGLDWEKRNKIIVGTAKGIHYLHDNASPRFIHRDIKASNILLDAEWKPKIADLGMAKLFNEDHMQQYTRRFAGTWGYAAPEYASTGRYSVKSDVYSFGVVILEIVRGKKNITFRYGENGASLVDYALILSQTRFAENKNQSFLLIAALNQINLVSATCQFRYPQTRWFLVVALNHQWFRQAAGWIDMIVQLALSQFKHPREWSQRGQDWLDPGAAPATMSLSTQWKMRLIKS
ncbi:hypothetical protein M0R45_011636 [Rubus argutus]|uniref:non-specific serine/threonine protein kinase n=1 Tax=Rubus argutus TaxID=59490 RepID=A0AAW1YAY8_RUBAR